MHLLSFLVEFNAGLLIPVPMMKRDSQRSVTRQVRANLVVWLVAMAAFTNTGVAEDPGFDFNRDIRPILSENCYQCHGPDEASREAGLRLDTFEAATEDLGGYAALVPGDLEASELWNRITAEDEDLRMPPLDHGPPLDPEQQELIKRWILSGGQYAQHWSYRRIERPAPPEIESDWIRNDIDRFVLRRIRERELQPSPEADRYRLIRRLSLDLTGLPPTPEQADQFASDDRPEAYEEWVDHFLAQPAYGERWAAMWLDHARYADSMGFAEDRPREIWAYRDYVIRSFNENKSFRDFTIEQLAGDLLPEPTEDQQIATAFHRNTLTNTEGGTIDEEFRSAAVVDRTNTTMSVWMGTTIACAQCHTHKYDPITQQEYYQLYAFFNGTVDNDQPDDRPLLPLYSEAQQQQRRNLETKMAEVRARMAAFEQLPVEDQQAALNGLQQEWEAKLLPQSGQLPRGRFLRLQLAGNGKILSLAEVEVWSEGRNIASEGTASQSSTAYDAVAARAVDGVTDGKFEANSVTHTATESNPWWELDLGRVVPVDQVSIWNRTDNRLFRRSDGLSVTLRDDAGNAVWTTTVEEGTAEPHQLPTGAAPAEILNIVATPGANRTAEQAGQLRDYFVEHHGPLALGKQELLRYEAALNAIQPASRVPVLQELSPEMQRETFVHHRGNYADPGVQVSRGVPDVFPDLQPAAEMPSRLDLARWLVDRENPLTARVLVNRYWQKLFGIGLVTTSEEFGTQGDLPTHPELLDYLAARVMDEGWDLKWLLKEMVMSATYRQSSSASAEAVARDPGNRWLARGPRFRLTAEMIRDQALATSGLLSQKMYGPPVQPPQPKTGLTAAFRASGTDWEDATGEDRYRRAIYTRWNRSNPYPSMTTFDVSNREVCEVRRLRTNTPLQALVTLNDPVFVEAAQGLARAVSRSSKEPRAMAIDAFRRVLVRPPSDEEIAAIVDLYESTLVHFRDRPEDAAALAVDPLNPVSEGTDLAALASWTTVANVLLNLDETLMKP